MATLEARAIISAVDETGKAFASLKTKIGDIDKSIEGMNRTLADVGKIDASVGKMSARLEGVAKSVAQVSQASQGLRGEFERLQVAQDRLASFKMLQQGYAQARQTFALARADVERLGAEMNKAAEPTAALKREYASAQAAVERASRALRPADRASSSTTPCVASRKGWRAGRR
jgi:DNA repair ATPase RecN